MFLHNISTGRIVEENVRSCLLNLESRGMLLLKSFVQERFIEKTKSVFDHLPRTDFKNFTFKQGNQSQKTHQTKELLRTQQLLAVQNIFMLAIQRDYDLKILSSHELIPIPKSLADEEGFFTKAVKYQMMEALEKYCECISSLDQIKNSSIETFHVFDGMAIVHLVQLQKFQTFGEFAEAFFRYITSYFSASVQRIDVVFDRYDDLSVKFMESILRSKGHESEKTKIASHHTKIPRNIISFLASPQNKQELCKFLCEYALKHVLLNGSQELFLAGGFTDEEMCYRKFGNTFYPVDDLKSNHTEADTRLFTHINHILKVSSPGSQIVVNCNDTDVFVLCVFFWFELKAKEITALWMNIKSKKSRLVGCHNVAESLGYSATQHLPALHAFTGCDTTSKISTKYSAVKMINNETYAALKAVGTGSQMSKDEFSQLEKLYLKLIGKPGITADEARYLIFSRDLGTGVNLSRIPCTSDALLLHCLRASFQAYVWKNAMNPQYQKLEPTTFGYELKDNCLMPVFTTKIIMPDDLLPPCHCKRYCATNACSCRKKSVNCIKLCSCNEEDCKNTYFSSEFDK